MGRPFSKTTKYPRRKKVLGRFVKIKKSVKKSNVRALQKMLTVGKDDRNHERAHDPPSSSSIRALRQLLGFTQGSFAAQLGVSAITIHQWEVARRFPNRYSSARLLELATMNDLDLHLLDDPDYYRNHLQVRIFVEKEKSA